MKEWKTYKLEDLLSTPVRNGLTKPSSIRGKGVKMIGMGELFANEIIRDIEMPRVPTTESELKLSSIEKGDLLFARQSLTLEGAGKCSLVKEVTEPTVFESHIIRCRVNKSLVLPEYLYYYFRSRFGRYKIECIVEQVAAAGIRGKDLIKIEIPVPDIQTQICIVDCLSTIDEKIHYNSLINDNLEQQAQALYKSWFVDFEPFKDGEFVESEFGLIPKGWKTGSISDISKISSGKRPAKKCDKKNNIHNIPVYGASGIMAYTNDVLHDSPLLLIGRVGTLGVIQRVNRKSWPSDNTLIIFTQFYNYIYFILQAVDYSAINRGSTQPLITQTDINQEGIVIPSLDVLEQFEDRCNSLYKMIAMHKDENIILETIRDTLLPKLMSGEIKINEIDC